MPLIIPTRFYQPRGVFDPAAAGAAYTGPGDIATFTAWWGFRAYSAAAAGVKPAIRVVRASDSAQSDIGTLANGSLDASTLATFLSATTGKVVTVYDQVGTNNMTQGTDATRPAVTASALNSSYGATFNGSNEMASVANLSATGQPSSVSLVAKRTSGTAFSTVFSVDGSGNVQVGFSNSANNALIYAGTVVSVASVNDNTFHAINTALAGASTIYNIDGATGTVSAGVNGPIGSSAALLGSAFALSNPLTGVFMEAGFIATTGISAGVASSLNSNQHAAYGSW